MHDFAFYIFCGIAIIIAVLILKKVAGCLFKSVLTAIVVALLVVAYFLVFKQD